MPVQAASPAVTAAPVASEWAPVAGQFDPPIYEYRPGTPGPASAEIVMAGLPPVHEITGTPPPAQESALFPNWGATTAATPAPPEAIPGASAPPTAPVLTLEADPYPHDAMWPPDAERETGRNVSEKAHSSKLLIILLAVVAVAALLYSVFFLL